MFEFEEGATLESRICITPDTETNLRVQLHPDEPIDQYIDIERDPIDIYDVVCVPYAITFPDEYDIEDPTNTLYKPGENRYKIKVFQLGSGPGATISAVKVLSHVVNVVLPYPGKYLEPSFQAFSANRGLPIQFNARLEHKGTESINKIDSVIAIFNSTDHQIATVLMDSHQMVMPGQIVESVEFWETGTHMPGKYYANLTVKYDGVEAYASSPFSIGTLDFDVVDTTKNMTKLGIQPYDVFVENLWGEEVKGVSATVRVHNATSPGEETFDTVSADVGPFKTARLRGFYNTEVFDLGEQQVDVTLRFRNETKSFTRTVVLLPPVLPEEPGFKLTTTTVLIVVIAGLLLLLIAGLVYYFVILKRRKHESH